MSRKEFMEQLRRLLYDIPAKDREEALEYYEGYFDDAGEENEDSVIRELGSPGRIAAEIKAGLNPDPDAGEYTEAGYRDDRFEEEKKDSHTPVRYRQDRRNNGTNNGTKILLLIILAALTFPVWGAALGALFTAVMAVFGILLGILAGTLFGGIGLTIGSIAIAVVGVINMASSFSLGITLLGTGLMLLGLGILLLIAFGWIVTKAIPAVFRLIVDVFHRIFHKNRKEETE